MEFNVIKVIGKAASFNVQVCGKSYPVSVPIANMPRRIGRRKFVYLDGYLTKEDNDILINWMQNWVDRESIIKYTLTIPNEITCGVTSSYGFNPRRPSEVLTTIIEDLFERVSLTNVIKYGESLYVSSSKTSKRELKKKFKEESEKPYVFNINICGREMKLELAKSDASKHHRSDIESLTAYYQDFADICLMNYVGYKTYKINKLCYQTKCVAGQKIFEFIKIMPKSDVRKYSKMLYEKYFGAKKKKKKSVSTKKSVKLSKDVIETLKDILVNGTEEELNTVNALIKNHEKRMIIKRKMEEIARIQREIDELS